MGYLMLLGIGIHTYAWHGSPSVHSDYNSTIGFNAIDPKYFDLLLEKYSNQEVKQLIHLFFCEREQLRNLKHVAMPIIRDISSV